MGEPTKEATASAEGCVLGRQHHHHPEWNLFWKADAVGWPWHCSLWARSWSEESIWPLVRQKGHPSHTPKEICASFSLAQKRGSEGTISVTSIRASGITNRSHKMGAWMSYQGTKRQKSNLGDDVKWNKSKLIGVLSLNHCKGKS